MYAEQDELYCKCASKLDRALSKHDCDLRIVVGHSNMLEVLMTACTFRSDQHDGSECDKLEVTYTDYEARSGLLVCSEHPNDPFPILTEASLTEIEMSPTERDESCRDRQFIFQNSHIVMRPALPVQPKMTATVVAKPPSDFQVKALD